MWGVVGAAAPEIVRLYKIITGGSRQTLPEFTFAYFAISTAFAALGGLVALAWDENNLLKCFWVGVSLPAIVSSFARQAPLRR